VLARAEKSLREIKSLAESAYGDKMSHNLTNSLFKDANDEKITKMTKLTWRRLWLNPSQFSSRKGSRTDFHAMQE
jgi:hypothetical protein